MAWSFNVFTGNLDQTGSSGAVVFEGEVETFADLSETIGDPAVGASFLVRSSTGVWLVNRRQAGIWIRKNNTGVRATDWEYGGDYPVNSVNGQTGNVSLTAGDVGAVSALETRSHGFFSNSTYTLAQGRNVQLNVSVGAIGATGTITLPRLTTDSAQNGDDVFIVGQVGVSANTTLIIERYIWTGSSYTSSKETVVTATTSGAWRFRLLSGVWTLQPVATHTHGNLSSTGTLGSTSGLPVVTTTSGAITTLPLGTANQFLKVNSGGTAVEFGAGFDAASPPAIGNTTPSTGAFTTLNATGTTELVNGGTTAGPFRVYNTSSSANANYERGFMQWTSNNFEIGCEAAGTGTLRPIRIKTDATAGASGQGYIEFGGSSIINSIKSVGGTASGALYIFSQSTLRMLIGGSSGLGIYQTIIPLTTLSQDVGTTALRWRDVFCRSVDLTGNLILPTATGTKIGTATNQLLGFYGVTPVDQPATVTDAATQTVTGSDTVDRVKVEADLTSCKNAINAVIDRLQELGLIA